MHSFEKSNNLLILLLLIIALVIVFVSFLNVKVNLNKKASGSGVIRLSINNPRGTSIKSGDTFSIDINLASTWLKQVRVAGADLSFDLNVFSIQSVTCNNNFPLTAKAVSLGNKISLSCFRPAGAAFALNPNQAAILGTIGLRVKESAPSGNTVISFSRTKIPEAGTSLDISDSGSAITYSVSGGGQCSLKNTGDANCDNRVDIKDFFVWRREFLSGGSTKNSDFNQDGFVNVRDFNVWRRGFLGGR